MYIFEMEFLTVNTQFIRNATELDNLYDKHEIDTFLLSLGYDYFRV